MKVYIKIAEILLLILIDTRVSVCIIFKDFARKYKLRIEINDETKVTLLRERNRIKVIGLISNVLIAI